MIVIDQNHEALAQSLAEKLADECYKEHYYDPRMLGGAPELQPEDVEGEVDLPAVVAALRADGYCDEEVEDADEVRAIFVERVCEIADALMMDMTERDARP